MQGSHCIWIKHLLDFMQLDHFIQILKLLIKEQFLYDHEIISHEHEHEQNNNQTSRKYSNIIGLANGGECARILVGLANMQSKAYKL